MNADFKAFAARCPHYVETPLERRPGNALNVEIGAPVPRCTLKEPDHWPQKGLGPRWLFSGGSPLVFGFCSEDCPRLK